MWKLTISQPKQCGNYTVDNEVTFTSDDLGALLDIAEFLVNHSTPAKGTSYELTEVKEVEENAETV